MGRGLVVERRRGFARRAAVKREAVKVERSLSWASNTLHGRERNASALLPRKSALRS